MTIMTIPQIKKELKNWVHSMKAEATTSQSK